MGSRGGSFVEDHSQPPHRLLLKSLILLRMFSEFDRLAISAVHLVNLGQTYSLCKVFE